MKYADRKCARICIYFKYHTEEQRERLLNKLNGYLLSRGQSAAGVFSDRVGEPAFELRRLMQCVMLGGVNILIVPSIDVLGEDRLLIKTNIAMCIQNRTELICLKYDNSLAEYWLLHAIRDYFSLGSRWDNEYGDLYRKQGYEFHAGGCPLGYRRGENGEPQVDEDEAEIVRKVFGMRSIGINLIEITKRIANEDGIELSRGVVRSIIENERYCGKAYGRSGAFPPIVPNGLWLKANSVQHMRSVSERSGKTHLLKFVHMRDGRTVLMPGETTILRNCDIAYCTQLSTGLIEANAEVIDDVVSRLVSQRIRSDGTRLCEELKVYKRSYGELMLKKMKALENSSLLTRQDVEVAAGKLGISDFEKFERLKLQVMEIQHKYVRAKLDYMLCCIEDYEIDEFFSRMSLFNTLGALEKRYYIDLFVRKVEIVSDTIRVFFFDGQIFVKRLDHEIMSFRCRKN